MLQLGVLLLVLEALLCPTTAFPIQGFRSTVQHNNKLAPRQDTPAIPAFALQYAPIMYLHSDEQW